MQVSIRRSGAVLVWSWVHAMSITLYALASAAPLDAQDKAAKVVPDAVSCARCSIDVRTVVTIGDQDGPGSLIGKPMSVNVDSRGRWWVFQELMPPTVFDARGAVIGMISRKGKGPGEYEAADYGYVVGDSMLVFDWLQRRVTVVGPTLGVVRQFLDPIPGHRGILVQWPDQVVIAGNVPGSTPKGSQLHRVSYAGVEPIVMKSFGPQGTGDPMQDQRLYQLLGPGPSGRFWSAWANRPEFTRWTATGGEGVTIERVMDWFRQGPGGIGSPTTPPSPMTATLAEDDDGLLWYYVLQPSPTWQDGWPKDATRQREVRMIAMAWEKLYRTYVEVIDPAAGRVLARTTFEGAAMHALPGRRVSVYRTDTFGVPKVAILEMALRR